MSNATYTIVARMFGRDIPMFTVHGYEWAETLAARLRRTGHDAWLRECSPISACAEVIPASGVEITAVV